MSGSSSEPGSRRERRAARPPSPSITLLTDFGLADDYVGVCHAVIARLAPGVRVIDLAHGIPPCDVRAGAHVLARALAHTEPGVHVAVVDPGVGGGRRAVAVRLGADGRVLLGPDNGVLALAIERLAEGGALEAFDISRSPLALPGAGGTFDGRDLFAPVAASIARGEPLEGAGVPFDPATLAPAPGTGEPTLVAEGSLAATVVLVDRFGNAVLAAGRRELEAAELAAVGIEVEVEVRPHEGTPAAGDPASPPDPGGAGGSLQASGGPPPARIALVGRAFGDVDPGGLLVHLDAYGAVELAAREASAAELLGLEPGARVALRRARG